eukprot:gene17316-23625_t
MTDDTTSHRLRGAIIIEFASPKLNSAHVVQLFDTFIGGPFVITTEEGDEEIQQSSTRVFVARRTSSSSKKSILPIPVILDNRAFASAPPSSRTLYSLFLVFVALKHGNDTVALRDEIRKQFNKAFVHDAITQPKAGSSANVRTVLRCMNNYLRTAPLVQATPLDLVVTLEQCPSLNAIRYLPSTQECMAAKALAVVVAHAVVNGERDHVLPVLDAVAAMVLPNGSRVLLPTANKSLAKALKKKRSDLGESTAPVEYLLDLSAHEHCDKCRVDIGIVGGTNVSHVNGTLVDIENDLKGINRPSTKCPGFNFLPTADGSIQGKEYIKPVCHPRIDMSSHNHLPVCQFTRYPEHVQSAPPTPVQFTCPPPTSRTRCY